MGRKIFCFMLKCVLIWNLALGGLGQSFAPSDDDHLPPMNNVDMSSTSALEEPSVSFSAEHNFVNNDDFGNPSPTPIVIGETESSTPGSEEGGSLTTPTSETDPTTPVPDPTEFPSPNGSEGAPPGFEENEISTTPTQETEPTSETTEKVLTPGPIEVTPEPDPNTSTPDPTLSPEIPDSEAWSGDIDLGDFPIPKPDATSFPEPSPNDKDESGTSTSTMEPGDFESTQYPETTSAPTATITDDYTPSPGSSAGTDDDQISTTTEQPPETTHVLVNFFVVPLDSEGENATSTESDVENASDIDQSNETMEFSSLTNNQTSFNDSDSDDPNFEEIEDSAEIEQSGDPVMHETLSILGTETNAQFSNAILERIPDEESVVNGSILEINTTMENVQSNSDNGSSVHIGLEILGGNRTSFNDSDSDNPKFEQFKSSAQIEQSGDKEFQEFLALLGNDTDPAFSNGIPEKIPNEDSVLNGSNLEINATLENERSNSGNGFSVLTSLILVGEDEANDTFSIADQNDTTTLIPVPTQKITLPVPEIIGQPQSENSTNSTVDESATLEPNVTSVLIGMIFAAFEPNVASSPIAEISTTGPENTTEISPEMTTLGPVTSDPDTAVTSSPSTEKSNSDIADQTTTSTPNPTVSPKLNVSEAKEWSEALINYFWSSNPNATDVAHFVMQFLQGFSESESGRGNGTDSSNSTVTAAPLTAGAESQCGKISFMIALLLGVMVFWNF